MEKTYKIIRMFANTPSRDTVICTGLTLKEAQEWCRDPETSSRTATSLISVLTTKNFGPWFDGYEAE